MIPGTVLVERPEARITRLSEWDVRVRGLDVETWRRGSKAKLTLTADAIASEFFGATTWDFARSEKWSEVSDHPRADAIAEIHRSIMHTIYDSPPASTPAALAADAALMAAIPSPYVGSMTRPQAPTNDIGAVRTMMDKAREGGHGRCQICDDSTDTIEGRMIKGRTVNYRAPILGLLCKDCRNLFYPAPGYNEKREATDEKAKYRKLDLIPDDVVPHAWMYGHAQHKCDLCHVGFDTARQLAAHRTHPVCQTLAWIKYQRMIGNVVMWNDDAFVPLVVAALGLKPNEPNASGWYRVVTLPAAWEKRENKWALDHAFEAVEKLVAVPPRVIDSIGGAIMNMIALETDRIKQGNWDATSDKAARLRRTILPLMAAVALHHAGYPVVNERLRLAWGFGGVETTGGTIAGQIGHRINETRREAFTWLGPSFFDIVRTIWGRTPGKLPTWMKPGKVAAS